MFHLDQELIGVAHAVGSDIEKAPSPSRNLLSSSFPLARHTRLAGTFLQACVDQCQQNLRGGTSESLNYL